MATNAFRIQTLGMRRTLEAFKEYGVEVDKGLMWIVDKTSNEIVALAKAAIEKESKGYWSDGRWVSRPGDAPNKQSGDLLNSLSVDNHGLYADIRMDDFKAGWMELGTRRMKARPVLRPALKKRRYLWNKRLKDLADDVGVKLSRKSKAKGVQK